MAVQFRLSKYQERDRFTNHIRLVEPRSYISQQCIRISLYVVTILL